MKIIKPLLDSFEKIVKSDMNLAQKILFIKFFLELPEKNIRKYILEADIPNFVSSGEEKASYLVNPPLWKYDGAWVLEPRTGNFEEIHQFIACQLESPNCTLKP